MNLYDDFEPPSGPDDPARRLARRSHPATSHAAAESIVDDLADLHRWAFECVSESPGRTQRELGSIYCPTDPRRIGRRLGELAKLGRLCRGPERPCTISGRMAETWWPVETETL